MESDGGDELYEEVLNCFNSGRIENQLLGVLRDQAEDLLEKVEGDYLEAEGPIKTGPSYPKASYFNNEKVEHNASDDLGLGRALTALTEMPDELTEFDYWIKTGNKATTYDMTSVDYENLCDLLEAVTRIEDEDLDWNMY